jgi:dTDP-4-amino-4,6-dideoxygalactose transaminase
MLTTSDQRLAERLRLLRVHGMQPRYYHRAVGINSRLDTIQAAVLNVKMNHLAQWTARRQTNAARYHQLFSAAYLGELVEMPIAAADCEHVWNQFTIRVRRGEREALRAYLSAARIGTEIYYPVPLHRQECFAGLGYAEGSLPETELAAKEVLSLPIFPDLKVDEQEAVVGHIVQYIRTSRGQCVPQRAAA